MKKICVFFFILVFTLHFSQEYSILKKEVYESPKKTIPKIKNEIRNAEKQNNQQLISKLEYLNSFAYYLLENSDSCLAHAQLAIETAKKVNYAEGQALGLRMQGTQYARLGLLDKSKKSLDLALDLMKDKQGDEANEIKGLLWNSYLYIVDGNPKYKANERFDIALKSLNYYQKITNPELKKERLIAAYLNLGHLYNKEKSYDKAVFYMKEALKYVTDENSYMLVSIYYNLGDTYIEQKKLTEGIDFLNKALEYSEKYQIDARKKDILYSLSKAYDLQNNKEKAYFYLEEYNKLSQSLISQEKKIINKLDSENKKTSQTKSTAIWVGLGIFLATLLGFLAFKFRKKQVIDEPEISEMDTEKSAEVKISSATEQNILQQLQNFEKNKDYTSSTVTLYYLANKFHCNTKYLSATIKKSTNKSFSQYINDLRLEYIINELKTNPKVRSYKISHLAEMAGFASHAAFTTAFIAFTNEKPSVYIKNLSE